MRRGCLASSSNRASRLWRTANERRNPADCRKSPTALEDVTTLCPPISFAASLFHPGVRNSRAAASSVISISADEKGVGGPLFIRRSSSIWTGKQSHSMCKWRPLWTVNAAQSDLPSSRSDRYCLSWLRWSFETNTTSNKPSPGSARGRKTEIWPDVANIQCFEQQVFAG